MWKSVLPNNEAPWDRGVRLLVGFALLGVGLATQSWIVGLASLIPLITAVVGSCPAYTVLGVGTARRDPQAH